MRLKVADGRITAPVFSGSGTVVAADVRRLALHREQLRGDGLLAVR